MDAHKFAPNRKSLMEFSVQIAVYIDWMVEI